MSEPERDELGAIIPPKDTSRGLAAEAGRLLDNPAFSEAARALTQTYMNRFLSLQQDDPDFERQCMRIQIAVNCIGDIVGQLNIMRDNGKVDHELIAKTSRGNQNGR